MAVVFVATGTVKPDRMEHYLDGARKTKAVMEKQGAKNVRVLAAVAAGEATGSWAFIYETDDLTAFGASFDKMFADPDVAAASSPENVAANMVAGIQTTIWVDVPL